VFWGTGRDTHSYFKFERRRGCDAPSLWSEESRSAGDISNPFRMYSGGGPTLAIDSCKFKFEEVGGDCMAHG
jgi:hypothetical protein